MNTVNYTRRQHTTVSQEGITMAVNAEMLALPGICANCRPMLFQSMSCTSKQGVPDHTHCVTQH